MVEVASGLTHTRASELQRRFARAAFVRFELITDEKLMAVQIQLAVNEPGSVLRHHPINLGGAEDALVELERRGPAADNQLGDELMFSHLSSPTDP